ncbi:MAG: hypothetical protein Q8N39_08745 [Pelolinea sp.]|nr:hypothetical protein [Pelolinea sp.]
MLELIKIILVTSLVLVLTFGVWVYYRGTQPMEITEARGITFWQFIRERWDAYNSTDARISALPQYLGCRNDILYYLPLNLKGSANFTYASLNPDSKLAYAFKYWEEQKPDEVLPKVKPINIAEAPDTFWTYFERAYWRALVVIDYLAAECKLGPVNYDAILGGKFK